VIAFVEAQMALTEHIEATGFLHSSPGLPARSTWSELIDSLLAMYQLTDDWDGQGAKAPPKDLVRAALLLAQDYQSKFFASADRCIAGVNGTIFFEWHGNAGDYMEIEVVTPQHAEVRLVKNNSCKSEMLQLPR
jgi:hypothetical protein